MLNEISVKKISVKIDCVVQRGELFSVKIYHICSFRTQQAASQSRLSRIRATPVWSGRNPWALSLKAELSRRSCPKPAPSSELNLRCQHVLSPFHQEKALNHKLWIIYSVNLPIQFRQKMPNWPETFFTEDLKRNSFSVFTYANQLLKSLKTLLNVLKNLSLLSLERSKCNAR